MNEHAGHPVLKPNVKKIHGEIDHEEFRKAGIVIHKYTDPEQPYTVEYQGLKFALPADKLESFKNMIGLIRNCEEDSRMGLLIEFDEEFADYAVK